MKQIGILGSIAFDNIFNTESIPIKGERVFGELLGRYIGGMGANQAIEAARYSNNVFMLGMIGNDSDGKEIEAYLSKRNVNTDLILSSDKETTGQSYMHLVDGKDDYFSVVVPGANMGIDIIDLSKKLSMIQKGVLCISLEINLDAVKNVLSLAKEYQIYTYLCASPAEICSQDIIDNVDALILNEREAQILLNIKGETIKEKAKDLSKLQTNHDLILLTLGKDGALLKEKGQIYYEPALKVEVLDSVGAGDALTGAFIAAREMGLSPHKALSYSCIAGGLAVSVLGAQASTHTKELVEQYYEKFYKNKERLI